MLEHKTGVRCDECGAPMPCATVPLGGCLCDACWDAILDAELVRLEDEPSGQAFPDEPAGCEHCRKAGGGCGVCVGQEALLSEGQDFHLRDYLRPGGSRPYEQLAPDLEAALTAGRPVYLWSVPGFFMVAGHPGMPGGKPWSDGKRWYATAAEALAGK